MSAVAPVSAPHVTTQRLPEQQLSERRLEAWTRFNPPSARRTVQDFIQSLQECHGRYDFAQDPLSPGPALRPEIPRSDHESLNGERGETALVMHGLEDEKMMKAGPSHPSREPPKERSSKKKPSLAASLKPKQSAPQAPIESAKGKERAVNERPASKLSDTHSTSSPLLVARLDEAGHAQIEGRDDSQGVLRTNASLRLIADSSTKKTKRTRRAKTEPGKDASGPSTAVVDMQVDAAADVANSEDDAEERRQRRRERRRAKAIIVKDKSVTATAVGNAAAARVKTARRKDKRGAEVDENMTAAERRAKGKRTVTETAQMRLQDQQRASHIGSTSRLTIKPSPKIGLFSKGAASSRTKVPQRNLVFSEDNFLNAPRRSPTPPKSSSSAASSSPPPPLPRAKPSKAHQASATYGTKGKKRRSSSTPVVIEARPSSASSLSSLSMLPPPPPKRRSKEQDHQQNLASALTRPSPLSPRTPSSAKLRKATAPATQSPALSSPKSTKRPDNDTASLHSAWSLEQRRLSAQQASPERPQPITITDAGPETSAFWKNGRLGQRPGSDLHSIREEDGVAARLVSPLPSSSQRAEDSARLSSEREGCGSSSIDRLLANCNRQPGSSPLSPLRDEVQPFRTMALSSSNVVGGDETAADSVYSLDVQQDVPTLADTVDHMQLAYGGIDRGEDNDLHLRLAASSSDAQWCEQVAASSIDMLDGSTFAPKETHNAVPYGDVTGSSPIALESLSDEGVALGYNRFAPFASAVEKEGAGGAGSMDPAFRSAMKSHWYRSKC